MRKRQQKAAGRDGSPSRPFCREFSALPTVAPYHYSCSCPIELKKLFCSFGRRLRKFVERNLSRCCNRFCHDACIRRFRAFAAKRDRRQIWAIGFHHEFPERDLCCNFSHSRSVFESDNSSERNEMVEVE